MNLHSQVSEIEFSKSVKTCSPQTVISEVISILSDSKVGSIIILDQKRVVGIFTERDFLLRVGKDYNQFQDTAIEELMTKNPQTVTQTTPVVKVMELMHKGRFRHLAVTSPSGELEGVISIKDMMDYLLTTVNTLEGELTDLVASII
jgi:CBS domain-containing protein